ncbi:MAG: type II secretion system protein [Patescibacteria group bacterium]|nr:type II secretion system protein [Patescibacteria group bacterium]
MNTKNKKGFTLIELLVVVAIMGLLSALAVVALNQARARARDARRVADIKQIQTALELYYLDNNEYPDIKVAGDNTIGGVCLDSDDGFATDACSGTTYMAVVPENPQPRADGDCPNTVYTYVTLSTSAPNLTYQIHYCLGGVIGDVAAGKHTATPAGLVDDTTW